MWIAVDSVAVDVDVVVGAAAEDDHSLQNQCHHNILVDKFFGVNSMFVLE